jgi:uncharacterized protein (DUF885 family)
MNTETTELADRLWEGLLEINPLQGTYCGDERRDHLLPDPSEAGRARAYSIFRSALSDAQETDRTGLGEEDLATLDIIEAICRRFLSELELRLDRFYVSNHISGPTTLLGEISSIQQVDTPERLDRYISRLSAFGTHMSAWEDVISEAAATGVLAPRIIAERSVAQLERILALPANESPAMAPLRSDEDRERVATVVSDVVYPALARFRDALRTVYLPAATETIGMSALPDGDVLYASQVGGWTSLELDPKQVHAIGVERFEAIQEARREVARGLGYRDPAAAIAERTAAGANTAATREELLALAEDQVARSWEVAPRFFGRLPRENCEVRAVESFREADEPFAFYIAPTEDGSRKGVYYVNTFKLDDRALHHVASTTYHEANPGHHFQIALEQEIRDRPALRRFGAGLAAASFVEGWGLYSELLADEMGLYADDWERMGMLENQAHRAARLITDTGIHALGWTRDAAVAKLEEGGQTHTDSVIEVDRYIGWPGQALCYMIGMIEIRKARETTAEREGSSFSLQDFHDRVLAHGQLPLPAFRRIFGTGA